MLILGIETSCDETSAAVVKDGRFVLSNIIASQVKLHETFGGVVPELAARCHIENIGYVADEALKVAGVSLSDIDAFAPANGPGLAGALLVGVNYAKGLAFASGKPLIGVNHIEGHIAANYLDSELTPPFVSLVVSGGHSLILCVDDYDKYRILGSTRDDAAGEAFDKVARLLGLPYPGGPEVDKLAETGNPDAVMFPRAKVEGFDLSFSGLKTAVSQFSAKNTDVNISDVCASFRKAVTDVLITKTTVACLQEGYKIIALAGGVACNKGLRRDMQIACDKNSIRLVMPKPEYCTDNAAMIASRGYFSLIQGKTDTLSLNTFPARMGKEG